MLSNLNRSTVGPRPPPHGFARTELRPKHSNPAQGIERFEQRSRERFLSPRELKRLGMALARAERNKTESIYALAAVRLLIFTDCRRSETLELQWEDVSVERAMLFLAETKTGAKSVYLSAPALSVLASIPRISNKPFAIVGQQEGQHLVNLRKTWPRLRKLARLRDVRIHDLRHSFASIGVSGGASLPMIGKLLGHVKSSTTGKYSRLAADPVRAVNKAMGNQIVAKLNAQRGTVVELKPAKAAASAAHRARPLGAPRCKSRKRLKASSAALRLLIPVRYSRGGWRRPCTTRSRRKIYFIQHMRCFHRCSRHP